jgi:uncharacterized protein YabE (DUF348 family)/3D (Asp-Asp-Asp) domain-containing protein
MQNLKKKLCENSLLLRLAVFALVIVGTTILIAQSVSAKNIYVINDGGQVTVHTTYTTNPEDVLAEAGVELKENDILETTPTDDGAQITVIRGIPVTLDYCGQKQTLISYNETVAQLFARNGITLSRSANVSVPLDTLITAPIRIAVTDVLTAVENYTVSVPYETVYQETDSLKKGTEVVLVQGANGQMVCQARVFYTAGVETGREILSQRVTLEPVKQVIAVGTGDGKAKNNKPIIGDGVIIAGNGDVLTFTHRDTYRATAYCREEEGGQITATGTVTRVGAIAVDPRYIPYGTRMFIVTQDGKYIYGIATAEDCGGSIKGKRIDLFYETMPETVKFGIRDCDVYFLG